MGLTDTGIVRAKNEDCIGFDSALGLVVLADGMGGHRGGEIASAMTVDSIISNLQQKLPEISAGEVDEAKNGSGRPGFVSGGQTGFDLCRFYGKK